MTLRRKKLVRVHFRESDSDGSIEGILLGRVSGHYRLANVKYLSNADSSRAIDGEALVPVERVLFVQVLAA